jgi:signal transduction histidine kinase
MGASEDTFARLVSLAVHDLRTPLATLSGFARTLQRSDLGDPNTRYVEIMVAASDQLAELLDDLGLASRIESGRWEPNVQDVDSLELARAAVEPLGEAVDVRGAGTQVTVARDDAARALEALARCALRHGGLERVELQVDGAALTISPVTAETAEICLGRELRDFGAAVAVRVIDALGGSTEPEGETIVVRLPVAAAAG